MRCLLGSHPGETRAFITMRMIWASPPFTLGSPQMLRRILSLVAALLFTGSIVAMRPVPGRNSFAANHGLFQSRERLFAELRGNDQSLFFRASHTEPAKTRPDRGRECMAAPPSRNSLPDGWKWNPSKNSDVC